MSSSASLDPSDPAEVRVLDDPSSLDSALVERYGHLLPDSLIRRTVDAAPAPQAACHDVAALADAALRAPEPGTPR